MIIRSATADDAADMTALLNQIITAGGTTAHQRPFDKERMLGHYIAPPDLVCCYVAEVAGRVMGFQCLVWPDPDQGKMPDGWALIASFVAPEAAGQGIGQQLFEATRVAAKQAGVSTIDATIRADNTAGLRYYGGLGFGDYDRLLQVPLRDGTNVDRVQKSYDLDGVDATDR